MADGDQGRVLEVDGHTWVVRERPGEPWVADIGWVSGPNEGYGFSSSRADRRPHTNEELVRGISSFLAAVSPATGYLG